MIDLNLCLEGIRWREYVPRRTRRPALQDPGGVSFRELVEAHLLGG